jgi:hypothetical protein
MNLHNLPNVIGAQRQLLKALDNADICSDDMLKLSELDSEFGKLSSIVATIYSKVPTVSDVSLTAFQPPVAEDVNKEETTETEVKTETKTETQQVEWVPVTKLRNMYPVAYMFLKHRIDLSPAVKEEIWDIFKKNYPDYKISENDFYRLMRLVINIRTEKAREIDDKVNDALTPVPVPSDTAIENTSAPQNTVEESESEETTEVTTATEVATTVEEPSLVSDTVK